MHTVFLPGSEVEKLCRQRCSITAFVLILRHAALCSICGAIFQAEGKDRGLQNTSRGFLDYSTVSQKEET